MRKFPIPEISAEEEEKLWQKSLFVFDTSALCRLYSLTDEVRDNMLVILDVLKPDIWLPQRVMLEFDRHKREELQKPLGMYGMPGFLGKSHISKELNDYIDKLQRESYRHPKVEQSTIDSLSEQSKELDNILEKIRVTIEKALKGGKEKVEKAIKQDLIGESIDGLEIGDCLTIEELKDIVAEGHIRYTYKIPPGYEDTTTKSSIDAFGDLIIWKEIIKKAKEQNTSVILIIQDLKQDWNAIESDESIIPREELLIEFEAETGKKIWMYTISDFLTKLGQFKAGVQAFSQPLKNIDKLKRELELTSISDDEIKICCSHCNRIVGFSKFDFAWEWEWYSQDDRDMGPEISYACYETMECPHCNNDISVNFYAYQYPIGVINYVECESSDCEILYQPDNLEYFIDFPDIDVDITSCNRCGTPYPSSELDDNGYCHDCINEIDEIMNSDD